MLLDLLFPKKCLNCNREGKYICEICLKKVPLGGWNQGIYSIFKYEGVIRKAILALKYKYSTEIAKELASACVDIPDFKDFVLVPIPLHWHRQNVRGFNQSEEVGKLIAKNMNWQFMPDFLIKTKSTRQQVGLVREDRLKNLENVFSVNSKFKAPDSVILFDDVFTTGSTLKEAAKVLKRAGVEKVWGLTIAR